MARLATLDPAQEAQLHELEQEYGAWLVAFAPPAGGGQEPPPAFARRLTPARLEPPAVKRLQELERRSGLCVVAYTPLADA
ncbi:MAG TPA: hypothetical protein VFX49_06510 [Chloroflexota bacterium]|nr:hypothetical protein [Chloroflexota bacterium]